MRFPNFFLLSGTDEASPEVTAYETVDNAIDGIRRELEDIAKDYDMTEEEVEENTFCDDMYASLYAGRDEVFYWWLIVPVDEIEWGD